MARPLTEILQSFDDAQAAQPDLSGLNSPSQTSIYKLWKYICALCQYLLEVIIDKKTVENEAIASQNYSGSATWLKARIFEFQYSSTNPQQVFLDANFHPYYPVVDPSLRLITRCAVIPDPDIDFQINVIVAKGEPPQALLIAEQQALTDYLSTGYDSDDQAVGIGFVGVTYFVKSNNPDNVYLDAEITYNAQYNGSIENAVILAINQYLTNLGTVNNFKRSALVVQDLNDAIRAVPGVIDIFINDLAIRDSGTTFPFKTYLIQSHTQTLTSKTLAAGYAVSETTATHTLTDSLTFTPS